MNQNLNQDDVLETGVEASAFGAAPSVPNNPPSEKRKTSPIIKILLGGVGLFVAAVVALVLWSMFSAPSDSGGQVYTQAPAPAQQSPMMQSPPQPMPQSAQPAAAVETQVGVQAQRPVQIPGDTAAAGVESPPQAPTAQVQPMEKSPVVTAPPVAQPAQVSQQSVPQVAAHEANSTQGSPPDRVGTLERAIEGLRADVDRISTARAAAERRAAITEVRSRQAPKPTRPSKRAANEDAKPSAEAPASARIEGVQLRAVVDTNAWVQLPGGENVMVTAGEKIPGVGTVKSVNPDKGSVQLTDGRVIR